MTLTPEQIRQFVADIRELAEASNRPGQSIAVAQETLLTVSALPIHQGKMVGGVGICAPDCVGCLIGELAAALARTWE